jgi:hypothetical protein
MRTLSVAALGFGLWLAAGNTASADTNYPWCIITGGLSEGAYSCGYVSFEQCQQTRLGTDMCVVNPMYKAPSSSASRPAPAPRERIRR